MPMQVAVSVEDRAISRVPFVRLLSIVVLSVAIVLTLFVGHIDIEPSHHGEHTPTEVISATVDLNTPSASCEVDPACAAFIVPLDLIPIRSSDFRAQPRIVRTGSLVPLGGPTVSLPPPRSLV